MYLNKQRASLPSAHFHMQSGKIENFLVHILALIVIYSSQVHLKWQGNYIQQRKRSLHMIIVWARGDGAISTLRVLTRWLFNDGVNSSYWFNYVTDNYYTS